MKIENHNPLKFKKYLHSVGIFFLNCYLHRYVSKLFEICKFDPSIEADNSFMGLTNLSDMFYIGCLPHNRIHRKTMQRSFQVKRKMKFNKQIINHHIEFLKSHIFTTLTFDTRRLNPLRFFFIITGMVRR
jgi:hypothetical protein